MFVLGVMSDVSGSPEKLVVVSFDIKQSIVWISYIDKNNYTMCDSYPIYSIQKNLLQIENTVGEYSGLNRKKFKRKFLHDSLMFLNIGNVVYSVDSNGMPIISILGVYGRADGTSTFTVGAVTIYQDKEGYWAVKRIPFMHSKGITSIEFLSYGSEGSCWDRGEQKDRDGRKVLYFKGFNEKLKTFKVRMKYRNEKGLCCKVAEVSCENNEISLVGVKRVVI